MNALPAKRIAAALSAFMVVAMSPGSLADNPMGPDASPEPVLVTISTKGVEFRVKVPSETPEGKPVFVDVSIKNNTKRLMRRYDMSDTDYDIRLKNRSGTMIHLTPYAATNMSGFGTAVQSGGSHRLAEIAPGDAFSTRIELTKYFVLPVDVYYLTISAPVSENNIEQTEDLEFKDIKFEVVSGKKKTAPEGGALH
jgi:hypothetical protein